MAFSHDTTTENLLDVTMSPLLSPEPEFQRGRKQRRDFLEVGIGRAAIPSAESATFRGRCRYRSVSRYLDMSSLSRPTSQHQLLAGAPHRHRNTLASPSPSRRKLARITQLIVDRRCNQLHPRSRSPNVGVAGEDAAPYRPIREQQMTKGRSHIRMGLPISFEMTPHGNEVVITTVETVVFPLKTCDIEVPNEVSTSEGDDDDC